jgi:hypothetical protein
MVWLGGKWLKLFAMRLQARLSKQVMYVSIYSIYTADDDGGTVRGFNRRYKYPFNQKNDNN